jgi:microcystin-dependent protein
MSSLPAESVDNIGALSFPTGIGPFPWLGENAPPGWYMLKGGQGFQLELIADWPALAQLVGTRWGGDGITTFAMPNAGLYSRGPDGVHALWSSIGEDTHALTLAEIPAHGHSTPDIDAFNHAPGSGTVGAPLGSGDRNLLNLAGTGAAGGGAAHNNIPKTLVVNLIVKA